jgi:hypothetical protein
MTSRPRVFGVAKEAPSGNSQTVRHGLWSGVPVMSRTTPTVARIGRCAETASAAAASTAREALSPIVRCGTTCRCVPAYGGASGKPPDRCGEVSKQLIWLRREPDDGIAEPAHVRQQDIRSRTVATMSRTVASTASSIRSGGKSGYNMGDDAARRRSLSTGLPNPARCQHIPRMSAGAATDHPTRATDRGLPAAG